MKKTRQLGRVKIEPKFSLHSHRVSLRKHKAIMKGIELHICSRSVSHCNFM